VAAAGLNALTEDLFKRIAGAICGMVEMQGTPPSSWKGSRGKGMVALTEFKFSDRCCAYIRNILTEKGSVVIPFHA